MIEIINGSIEFSKEKYIAHQTNCVTSGRASGVAATIFALYPWADCYRNRGNYRSELGTIDIRGCVDDFVDERYVINMHAQYYPGRYGLPNEYDSETARVNAFIDCLDQIKLIDNLTSIAFPARIGCGLAGGNWKTYYDLLETFDYMMRGKVAVKLYDYP